MLNANLLFMKSEETCLIEIVSVHPEFVLASYVAGFLKDQPVVSDLMLLSIQLFSSFPNIGNLLLKIYSRS